LGNQVKVRLENLKQFCQAIVNIYGSTYLCSPNEEDLLKILAVSEERGFPGMLGLLDCMHWVWKNCPVADQGQYAGKEKEPTIVLEAVATHNLWIWHAFFGLPGTLNDITVLDRSPIFQQCQDGVGPSIRYTVNGNDYHLGYYLTDGIYPKYSMLIQSISHPLGQKKKHYAKMQEAYRKDVERAFGVLQARYAIIKNAGRLWKESDLVLIMKTVIILHNMTIEDEEGLEYANDFDYHQLPHTQASVSSNKSSSNHFDAFLLRYQRIHDIHGHNRLKEDLIEHLWNKLGCNDEES
jgi:hypothetical protein